MSCLARTIEYVCCTAVSPVERDTQTADPQRETERREPRGRPVSGSPMGCRWRCADSRYSTVSPTCSIAGTAWTCDLPTYLTAVLYTVRTKVYCICK